jgi:hypothetical protein
MFASIRERLISIAQLAGRATGCGKLAPTTLRPDYGAAMTPTAPGPGHWLREDQLAQQEAKERKHSDGAVSELVLAEWVGLSLVDRLVAGCGSSVRIHSIDQATTAGVLVEVGPDWCLVRDRTDEVVLNLRSVVSVSGLAMTGGQPPAGSLPLQGAVWREWARARRRCRWGLVDGQIYSGSVYRAGQDALDLLQHPSDRGVDATDPRVVVPYRAIIWGRSAAPASSD